MKNPLKKMMPLYASDAMELKSTREDFPAEDATDQDTSTASSSTTYSRFLERKSNLTLLKPSRDLW
jgi:hypothetical protein